MPLKKAPAWMKRPAGATFGFGGKLISFANQKSQYTDATGAVQHREHGVISVSQVITEHDLVGRSEQFEHAIAGGEKQTLQSYCMGKAQVRLELECHVVWALVQLLG